MNPSPWIKKFDEISASVKSSKPMMVEDEKQLSYGELFTRINQCTSLIAMLGLNTGDRVLLATSDSPSLIILFLSFLRNGITSVILNPGASQIEARNLAKAADVSAIFADEIFIETADLDKTLPGTVKFVTIVPVEVSNTGILSRFLGRKPDHPDSEVKNFPAILDTLYSGTPPSILAEDTLAYILFTSGTTSKPKGVEISHYNLYAQEQTFFNHYQFDANVKLANVLPMFHTDGLTHGPVLAFFAGATLHRPILQFRIDLVPHLLRSVYTLQITHFIAVPAILAMFQNVEEELYNSFRTDDFKFMISTAAYLDPNLWRQIEGRFEIRIVNVYGLTETVCEALYCGPDDETRKVGSVGKPIDCEARIVDDEGIELGSGETGELILKGDNVMSGYFRMPEETAESLVQGWFYTGDLAMVDEEGFYFIVGRKKNVIITGGVNVYPEDVTAVLRSMPGVVDAITFGVDDSNWGERVTSCVQAPEGTLTIEDVAKFCAQNLSREKLPSKIFIFPELPRGPAGKVIIDDVKALVNKEIENQEDYDSSGSNSEQVRLVAARVFNMNIDDVTMDSGPNNSANWNSLGHVEFLMELEVHFNFRLNPRDIMLIKSIGDAVRLIDEKKKHDLEIN